MKSQDARNPSLMGKKATSLFARSLHRRPAVSVLWACSSALQEALVCQPPGRDRAQKGAGKCGGGFGGKVPSSPVQRHQLVGTPGQSGGSRHLNTGQIRQITNAVSAITQSSAHFIESPQSTSDQFPILSFFSSVFLQIL